ncbi:hypothetical protein OH491_07590 [Termitidicoccus mucosus]
MNKISNPEIPNPKKIPMSKSQKAAAATHGILQRFRANGGIFDF